MFVPFRIQHFKKLFKVELNSQCCVLVVYVVLLLLAISRFYIAGIYVSYKHYVQLRDTGEPIVQQANNIKGKLSSVFNKQGFWVALLIFFVVLLALILIMVIFLRKRIAIAVTLIREGSKYVKLFKQYVYLSLHSYVFVTCDNTVWSFKNSVLYKIYLDILHFYTIKSTFYIFKVIKPDYVDPHVEATIKFP